MVVFSQESTATQVLTTATTQVPWPPSPMGTDITRPNVLFHTFIRYVYEWGISLGGIAVFIMLVWAGIEYLTSAGDPGKMSSAIKRIQSSVLGLVLLLTSWLVLNTINPQLVQLRQLPDLRGELVMNPIDLPNPDGLLSSCDFIVPYPEINFGGAKGKPIRFRERPRPDKDITEIIRIEGRRIRTYSQTWTSVKSFTRLTEEEKMRIAGDRLNIVRYDECGNISETGGYKEGGLCRINFYSTTHDWWALKFDPCGEREGNSPLPIINISDIKNPGSRTITCIEVVRRIPRCVPEECPSPPEQPPGVEQCPGPTIPEREPPEDVPRA